MLVVIDSCPFSYNALRVPRRNLKIIAAHDAILDFKPRTVPMVALKSLPE
jgi:hypothetical protein